MSPTRRLRDRLRPNWPMIALALALGLWVYLIVRAVLWVVL